MVCAGRQCIRDPRPAPNEPGLLLAGGPAARPPPVGAEMAGPGAAAGCARQVLEQLRRVSPGLGSSGPGGAGRLRQGSRSSSAPARPVLSHCSPRGKRPGDREGNVDVPKEPVLFPTPESICLNIIYFEQGSVTRGFSDCRKLEFLGDETSCLKRSPELGPERDFNSTLFFPSKECPSKML